MSAAEKLKALSAATPLEKYEIDLFRVLPQIVAVVEAAENDMDYLRRETLGTTFVVPETTLALCSALQALDAALTAGGTKWGPDHPSYDEMGQ